MRTNSGLRALSKRNFYDALKTLIDEIPHYECRPRDLPRRPRALFFLKLVPDVHVVQHPATSFSSSPPFSPTFQNSYKGKPGPTGIPGPATYMEEKNLSLAAEERGKKEYLTETDSLEREELVISVERGQKNNDLDQVVQNRASEQVAENVLDQLDQLDQNQASEQAVEVERVCFFCEHFVQKNSENYCVLGSESQKRHPREKACWAFEPRKPG